MLNAYACYLEREAIIHLRGPRTTEFLQGQFTGDLRKLSKTHPLQGALCNPQGRVITDARLIALDDDHILLRLRASLRDRCTEILHRYAQFSRVEVSAHETDRAILGLYGDLEPPLLPPSPDEALHHDGCVVLNWASGVGEVIAPTGAEASLETIAAGLQPGLESDWQAKVLQSGHYALESSDSEQFTPQTLNYDERGLIAFDKGCYTGQEVVARLHYKGRAKRRLRIFHATSQAPVEEPLVDSEGTKAGKVLRCVPASEGCVIAAEIAVDAPVANLHTSQGSVLSPA